jgi:pyruvate dehydrogenase E2 component (dihydrolipoamide acetyltransferase)
MATPILMPKQGNSVESCLIVAWKKQKGDTVNVGEVLCEVETDKAVMDVESTASGLLLETFFAEGDDVPVQMVIAIVGNPGESVAEFLPSESSREEGAIVQDSSLSQSTAPSSSVVQTPVATTISSRQEFIGVSPRAKKLATEKGVAVAELQGTGPGGRILECDIVAALATSSIARESQPNAITQTSYTTFNPSASLGQVLQPLTLASDVEAVPLQGIRKRIAERMLHSLQTTAQLTLNSWADARELLETRAIIKNNAEKFSFPNITINDLVMFAVARTLLQHPELNATFENDTVYKHKNIHLGFAVDTSRGLLVPVIKNAHQLRLPELATVAKRLASDAQDSRIAPDALQGGTFTVSNLGSFGIEHFTPVLNPPQVAILGVGTIGAKSILKDDDLQTHPHIALSLTVNHQVIDGAPAAKFLQTLSQNIASISNLLVA